MATNSHIEWTDATWNPVTGCTKVSPGCKHCYAERMANRLQLMGQPNYQNGFRLTVQPQMLELPLTWKAPRRIFVNSMSDLFHKDVPFSYIRQLFDVMARASWHQFQVLTKRGERLRELSGELVWPSHVWMGVSVENENYVDRIDDLRATGAAVKFLSLEPLLGALPNLNLKGIDWVIVGGRIWAPARDRWMRSGLSAFETNAAARTWRSSSSSGVASGKVRPGAFCEGRTYDEMPDALVSA